MKTKLAYLMILSLIISFSAYSQVKVPVKKKLKSQTEKRANKNVDKAIDKGFDKLEKGLGGLFKKKKKKNKQTATEEAVETNQNETSTTEQNLPDQKVKRPEVKWAKYDFVPGDQVIFEDAPSKDEENGEFPSRWDLQKGSCEIAEIDGKNAIMFLEGGSASIVPYIKNSNEDYLPDVFTIEMDMYFEPGNHGQRFWIKLRDDKNQGGKGVNESLVVYVNGFDFMSSSKSYPGTEKYNWGNNPVGGWKHIAVAYTKGKFKAYMDDTRLINVPHLEGNPWGITLTASGPRELNLFVKNIRIAKGGVKYYDRVLQDGKIIVNGIRFDLNKATIKPESNGAINKIFELMNKQADLNFSVEGHTDTDGQDDYNMQLSKDRAEAVMNRLIQMGISADRLISTGWGESKPLDNNTTAEGKANNRRVEFVKF